MPAPAPLRNHLAAFGQEHVLAWWDELGDTEQRALTEQISRIDLAEVRRLYERRDHAVLLPRSDEIQPAPVDRINGDEDARRLGQKALRSGKIGVLLVAGGQGSRLGFDHPKGMYPIGPVTNKSLFQFHAEKVLATARRYGRPVPFAIMTSPQNDAETRAFFEQHQHFGLRRDDVFFFPQGTMPAVDLETGRLLMEDRGRIFTSPNGHGGILLALADSGAFRWLRDREIEQVFYFQVDNPLVKVADPAFIGHHLAARAEASSKVVPKSGPADKLGNIVLVDGRCAMIEYSDMAPEIACETDSSGRLRFWAGSPAIHVFELAFLERMARGDGGIPFHIARKKVPHLSERAERVDPATENALKFEMFIFDVLPRAERWTVVETNRREEFEPLKNAEGPDSPASVRQAMSDLAGEWLGQAAIKVPRRADGHVSVPLEISPLLALDAQELAAKVNAGMRVDGPTYLG